MSTASFVPETRGLGGDEAWEMLRKTGHLRLLKDAFQRMRVADGFSHARSLALMIALAAVQGTVGVVAVARILNKPGFTSVVTNALRQVVPGPAGQILTAAAKQGHLSGESHGAAAALVGLIGALFAGTTAMGQMERGLNRIYGVEEDRPPLKKYGLALLFAVTAGSLAALSFMLLAFGGEVFHATGSKALESIWAIGRIPLAVALVATSITIVFRRSPRRRQPQLSWLAFGTGVSIIGWLLVTVGLAAFYGYSASFGQTYGPLAGVIALLIWCMLSAIAIFFGASVAAQLEAVRAGAGLPQDEGKVEESEPGKQANPKVPA